MADHSIDLRRRLVEAYRSKKSGTYAVTAALFGVGEATVSRLLRRFRETGDVQYKPKGGNNPRRVDLVWLRNHLAENPDARLVDRIEAWKVHSGKGVSVGAMYLAVRACGWTHKNNGGRPRARPLGRPSQARDIHRLAGRPRRDKADLLRRVGISTRLTAELRMGATGRKSSRQGHLRRLVHDDDDRRGRS